jgi:hypothetical protein
VPKKISNSILENKWPRNELELGDNPYEAPTLAYSKEIDYLVEEEDSIHA